ncbi:MAG: hypothetical protein M1837_005575 [Sclerophora amabilis]|nr:MAG: hypothetical protein M1837_005575 [Sclerophora amabilis]
MKYGHEYLETLKREDFPAAWVETAISYRQLKKCIKKVQRELSSFGINPSILERLMDAVDTTEHSELNEGREGKQPATLRYSFAEDEEIPRPRLLLVVYTRDGIPVDAGLSPETRQFLRSLAGSQNLSTLHFHGQLDGVEPQDFSKELLSSETDGMAQLEEEKVNEIDEYPLPLPSSNSDMAESSIPNTDKTGCKLKKIEIPLASDFEFFNLLQNEVSALDELDHREKSEMTKDVIKVGKLVSTVTAPTSNSSKADLAHWRKILETYIQANVFFSTNERNRGSRNAAEAAQQLQWFSKEATRQGLGIKFKKKESYSALATFLEVNSQLVRNLKFQEINQVAMLKILKKFDKRTALGVKHKLPKHLGRQSLTAPTIAKAICSTISEEVVTIVPQLSDYLCPICFGISYKPIRLRDDVVMEADSANLDPALINFLKRYFPDEVKAKQRENERAAAVDKWGEEYDKCTVM